MTNRDAIFWRPTQRAGRSARARRRGMSLIELMLVAALASILMSLVVMTLVSIRTWDRKFRDHGVYGGQLAQLSASIRADARRGRDVSRPTENKLTITAEDKSETRYELSADGCRRIVKHTANGPDEQSNLFTVGPTDSWELDHGASGRLPMTVVSLKGPQKDKSMPESVLLVVYAAVGADGPAPIKADAANESQSVP